MSRVFPAHARRDADATYYLHERYAEPPRYSQQLLPLYYRLKPLIPRRLRLALRRAYAPRQAARSFTSWPIEPLLVERQHEEFRKRLAETGSSQVPFVNFWPDHHRFAFILTHDVEGPAGVANIPRVLEIEQRYGLVSSWNFVAESYPIPEGLFGDLRAAGCEIGLHGITHDDTLFRHRASFERQLPKVHRYLEEWRAVGFRSPATHRNPDWMPELGCLYDSSFPDTDPYEPQPGGCCSIFPFFLDDLVELPVTLPQDHTMFEILRQDPTNVWLEKSRWIMANHGLVNVLVHPDYMLTEERLRVYDQLLGFLSAASDGWHARPCDVAAWWRRRASDGGDAPDAALAYAGERNGRIIFELGRPGPRAADERSASHDEGSAGHTDAWVP